MNSAKKIFVEISVGELMDKISILEIKQKNLKDKEKIKIVSRELESLNSCVQKDVHITDQIKSLYEDLKKINTKLWNIEDGKRDCERNGDFGEKFIKLARSVTAIYHLFPRPMMTLRVSLCFIQRLGAA